MDFEGNMIRNEIDYRRILMTNDASNFRYMIQEFSVESEEAKWSGLGNFFPVEKNWFSI